MNKFKVGDKVKCISMDDWYSDKLEIGEEYTITKYNNPDSNYLRIEEGKNCYEDKNFELVSLEFKVGDKVRRTGGDRNGIENGDIAIISAIDENNKWACLEEYERCGMDFMLDGFELVSDNLDQLIEDVNKGFKAYHELYNKHNDEVEL